MDQTEDNFALVCFFSSVCFFLVTAMMLGWHTVSVDWANTMTQATLKKPIHMGTPRGFRNMCGSAGCLQLVKSSCGSQLAPKSSHEHFRSAIASKLGFTESPTDPCPLCEKNMLLCPHVDDCGLVALDKKLIEDFVDSLKKPGFDLEPEDDFESCLGIGTEAFDDGT